MSHCLFWGDEAVEGDVHEGDDSSHGNSHLNAVPDLVESYNDRKHSNGYHRAGPASNRALDHVAVETRNGIEVLIFLA